MAAPTRVVERLRLRASSEAAVRTTVLALEDAFRTATLPDAGARLICVRRLHLGELPTGASAQALSLLLESRFANARWTMAHGAHAGAGSADVVWFRDDLEAHIVAGLRVANAEALDGWYWRLAMPGIARPHAPEQLRTIAFAVAAFEEGPSAMPAWTAAVVRAGHRDRLVAALRRGDGHALSRLARIAGLANAMRGAAAVPDVRHAVPAPAAGQPAAARPSMSIAPDDRAAFVDALAGRAAGRSRAGAGRIAVRSPARRPQPTSAPGSRRPAPAAAARVRQARGGPQSSMAETGINGRRGGPVRPHALPPADAAGRTVDVPRRRAADSTPPPVASAWDRPDAEPTVAGGLLFLLPVLERVGFAAWCAQRGSAEPEPDVVAAAVLQLLLARLGVDEEDPVWALAAPFRLHPARRDAASWLTRCRRYVRRRAHIGLASLVVRPARIAVTATHADVFFPLSAADARTRRAGLDIDPGWVPWFGRVVAFHYEDRPWS
jgi:hypothetical protein